MIKENDLVQVIDISSWSGYWKERISPRQTVLRTKKIDGSYALLMPLNNTDWAQVYVYTGNLRKI